VDKLVIDGHLFEAVSPHIDLLGEGPVWSVARQCLYWVDIEGKYVRRLSLAPKEVVSWRFLETTGSLTCSSRSELLIALGKDIVRFTPESAHVEIICSEPEADVSEWRYNDGKCDPRGRFWVGSLPKDAAFPNGSLWRLDERGNIIQVDTGFQVPNGLAWSPDGTKMYFADSRAKEIYCYDYDVELGVASQRQVFARTTDGVPDGATVDSDGFLWSAEYGAGRINRFAPDGRLHSQLNLPVLYPTSCAFGGPHMDILFVTSATLRTTADDLADRPLSGRLLAVQVQASGLPEPSYFDRVAL